jgi:predicted nucleic acid-binding protein
MIFVDTNIFIYVLTSPVTPRDIHMQQRSRELFAEIASGKTHAILSEVVVHELFSTMMSSRLRQMSIVDLCEIVRSILNWPGWVMTTSDKTVFLRALDILQQHPKLEFSDSVIAARAEALGATLATFDARLAKAYSGAVWE